MLDLAAWDDDAVWTDADRWNETQFRLLELGSESVTGLIEFRNEPWAGWVRVVLDDLVARGCLRVGRASDLHAGAAGLDRREVRRAVADCEHVTTEDWRDDDYVALVATNAGIAEYERLVNQRQQTG